MTSTPDITALGVPLTHQFADALPELSLDWKAEAVAEPRLLALNADLAIELGLDPEQLRMPAGLGLLTGTVLPDDARPVAQGYAGHQFGGYSPRLGDGRALLVGELAFGPGSEADEHVKVGVLLGSLTSALLAVVVLRSRNRTYRRLHERETRDDDGDGVPDVYQA